MTELFDLRQMQRPGPNESHGLLTHSLQADQASGFHIRSVLCVPIWNRTHQIIGTLPGNDGTVQKSESITDVWSLKGVAQILNRLDRKTFNDADQRLFEVRPLKNPANGSQRKA